MGAGTSVPRSSRNSSTHGEEVAPLCDDRGHSSQRRLLSRMVAEAVVCIAVASRSRRARDSASPSRIARHSLVDALADGQHAPEPAVQVIGTPTGRDFHPHVAPQPVRLARRYGLVPRPARAGPSRRSGPTTGPSRSFTASHVGVNPLGRPQPLTT